MIWLLAQRKPVWLKPFWLKISVQDGIASACTSGVFGLLCIGKPRQFMGRNRKLILEDKLSEAVWRTILRGPRPPGAFWPRAERNSSPAVKPAKPSAAATSSPFPPSKKGKGKGQRSSKETPFKAQGQPQPTEERKAQSLNPGRAVEGSPGPRQEDRGSFGCPRRGGSSSNRIEGGTDQGSRQSPGPACPRPGRSNRSVSISLTQEIEKLIAEAEKIKADVDRIGGQDPRWGTSVEGLAVRSQVSDKSIHSGQRPSGGNSSLAFEDCADGGVTGRGVRSGVEETEDVGVFPRSGDVGGRTSSPAMSRDRHGDDVNLQVGLHTRLIHHRAGSRVAESVRPPTQAQLSRAREGGRRSPKSMSRRTKSQLCGRTSGGTASQEVRCRVQWGRQWHSRPTDSALSPQSLMRIGTQFRWNLSRGADSFSRHLVRRHADGFSRQPRREIPAGSACNADSPVGRPATRSARSGDERSRFLPTE